MDVVILAGGLGTRLNGILDNIPKSMAKFNNKPFLHYIISQLKDYFNKIIICVGYGKNIIMDYFKDGKEYGIKIEYSIEKELLGTGGALKNAQNLIKNDFVLLNGDTYHELDYENIMKEFLKKNTNIMILTKTINPSQVTIVKTNFKNEIIEFKDRPKNPSKEDEFMNAGIYFFKKNILDLIPINKNVSLEKEIFPLLLKKGMIGLKYEGKYIDIGTPKNYKKFNEIINK
jgi:mannose-1-phosphate guanylyltransferase